MENINYEENITDESLDLELDQENQEQDNSISLEEFLAQNAVEGLTEEIVLCKRLKSFKFKIGSMSRQDLEKYQKTCILRDGKGKIVKQDTMLFNDMIVTNHCLYPNFKSAEFLQKLGVNTPRQALQKVLKTGEVTKLAEKIMEFNGFEEFEETRKKAKN